MVKMTAHGESPIMVAGLTEENIERLKAGQPIRMELKGFGVDLPGVMFIIYGTTSEHIEQQFSSLIGPNTKIIDES